MEEERERERRRMGGDRKVSGFAGAMSVQQRWRKMVSRGWTFFSGRSVNF